jgi:hypothetical protein
MTEDQIERWVERQVDRLDACYLNPANKMTEATYNERMKAIDRAAEGMRAGLPHFTALCA